ncbi:MAG: dipeptidase PepV [Tepidanaerobacteraceae bacterium]|jgi:succinyl-diaminopimelate desuccinylase
MDMEKVITSNETGLLKATSEILKIKSVKEAPLPNMPFGEGPAKALEYALALADSFGFKTKNLDNYAGWAEWGEGDKMIGILVHLDVVPEGSGWTYPPYGGEIHEGKIYGRGAIDDKGPAMAALFALKSLKDAGIKLNKRVRVIFGTDEESGCECMEYYLKHDEAPTMGFSPDANYPIINGEKGILTFSFNTSFPSSKGESGVKLLSLKGGHRPNMVPDYAEAHLLGDKKEIQNVVNTIGDTIPGDYEIEHDNGKTIIKSYGISAHGSTPEKGINAAMLLAKLVGEMKIVETQRDFIIFLNDMMGLDTTGKALGVDFEDKVSGPLTFNVGVVELDQSKATVTVNIRYPIKYEGEKILKQIRRNTPDSISIINISDNKPHYVSEDNPMIKELKEAYEKVTGEQAYCFSIGGGTYARMFNNCVAFGPNFPGKPELAHQKDEYIEIKDLMQNLRIYTYVLKELVK